MRNITRNTAAVLVVTLFTGLAVFAAIQLGGRLFGSSAASAQTVPTQSTGGQSSTESTGQSSQDHNYGQSDSSNGGSSDSGGSSGSDSSSDGQTYTCPATGCTASSCHATQ